jgi:SAM-dependent methyltransferase
MSTVRAAERRTPVAAYDPAPPLDDLARRAAAGELLVCWDRTPLQHGQNGAYAAPVVLAGWAYSRDDVVEVWVVVDGTTWVQAAHRLYRADLIQALDAREAGHGGFRACLTAEDCPPGRHEIEVIAVDGSGRAVGVSGTIEVVVDRDLGGPGEAADLPLPAPTLDGGGERYVPELNAATMMEAEHQARYRWACALAASRTVLDAGCGVGWGTKLLLDAGAAAATGLDLSEQALESARDRTAGRATLVRGDLQQMPFEDDSFGLVVCFEAIEHVEEPGTALDELRRVLAPGGVLLISSPNRGVYPDGNPFHLNEYSSEELEDALRARFAHVDVYRQQTHVGSLLADEATFALEDPATTVAADLRKSVGGGPGDELYTVAAASDQPLPELPSLAVLTDAAEVRHWSEALVELERRALAAETSVAVATGEIGVLRFEHDKAQVALQASDRARRAVEAEAAELRAALEQAGRERDETRRWLDQHRRSLSWRLTAPLRAAKRSLNARGER